MVTFPVAQTVKSMPAYSGDLGLIPGSGRSPGEVNSNPLQYSSLENPMDRGAWQATVRGHDRATNTHTHFIRLVAYLYFM